MTDKLSCAVTISEEEINGKKVFVAECEELGISDFGESVKETLENLKKAINLLLEEAPEKRGMLEKEEPIMVTRLFL